MRLAVGIEYAGGRYAGWQRQEHAPSVQAEAEAALSRVANHPVAVTCAGRTDAGVHALGQVIHFDSEAARSLRSWVLGANANLPNDIVVRWVARVDAEFHARYSALSRSYRYVVLNRATRPAVDAGRVGWMLKPLAVGAMQQAARCLVGEHDFSAFRAAQCQAKSPVRRLTELRVERRGDRIEFAVTANAFLHHMVRNLVGTLLSVGLGEHDPDWVAGVLERRERAEAGVTAPAGGLYLESVRYPEHFGLPAGGPAGDSAIIGVSSGSAAVAEAWPPFSDLQGFR